MTTEISVDKRRTLKILTGAASIGIVANTPVMASLMENQWSRGGTLECKLISRADISRAHLLMQNNSDTDIVVTAFRSQKIRYDKSLLNLSDTSIKALKISAKDRVMIRLDTELQYSMDAGDAVDMQVEILPLGTRVTDMNLLVNSGVAELDPQIYFL